MVNARTHRTLYFFVKLNSDTQLQDDKSIKNNLTPVLTISEAYYEVFLIQLTAKGTLSDLI